MRSSVSYGTLATVLSLVSGACSVPDKIERRGNFEIQYFRTDALGHTSTRRALYHLDGSRKTLVADTAVSFLIAPIDRDRIIYDTCDPGWFSRSDSGKSSCAHVYFDGHTGEEHVIGRGLKVSMSHLEDVDRWSWNGNYVVIGDEYELVLVDLRSGKSTRLAETLRLEQPFYPERWQYRRVGWGAWSPDGAHGAVIVSSPHGPGLPVNEWDEELYSLDAATGALTLVATHTGLVGAERERRPWRAGDFRWDGATLQPPR